MINYNLPLYSYGPFRRHGFMMDLDHYNCVIVSHYSYGPMDLAEESSCHRSRTDALWMGEIFFAAAKGWAETAQNSIKLN